MKVTVSKPVHKGKRIGRIVIDPARCKSCELCIAVCPRQVIALSDTFTDKGYRPAFPKAPERCTGCALCAEMCPDVAVEVWRESLQRAETEDG